VSQISPWKSSTIDRLNQWFTARRSDVSVSGRDIYAITAPVQRDFATERILWLARIVFSMGTHHARPS